MSHPREREQWLDNTKTLACIFVVLGHLFQSMVKAEILPDSRVYQWFNATIYTFHVPLFFICSGYLYQKNSKIGTLTDWGKSISKKAITLGVPYIVFSMATWLLKSAFSGFVNNQIGGFFDTLLLYLTSPYWYLYCLLFIYLVTPTFSGLKMMKIGLALALSLKILTLTGRTTHAIYAVSSVMTNSIWFVLGMCLCMYDYPKLAKHKHILYGSLLVLLVFFTLSILISQNNGIYGWVGFGLGIMACWSIVSMMIYGSRSTPRFYSWRLLSKYTMPIFLMHTIFAASLRSLLFVFGVENQGIHIVMGIAISFIGPMVMAMIMRKYKWMNFFLYPSVRIAKYRAQES